MHDERLLGELIRRSLDGSFDRQRFLGSLLGDAAVMQQVDGDGSFDPQALVRLLDDASTHLASVGAEMDAQISALHRSAVTAEMLLRKSMSNVKQSMADMGGSIDDIERRFQEVGSSAVRIGERLSSTEQQRRKLAQAEEWLLLLNEFQHMRALDPDAQSLEAATPGFLKNRTLSEIAEILYSLRRITGEMTNTDMDRAGVNIQQFSDIVEHDMLRQFEDATMNGSRDTAAMKSLANLLQLFNNGQSLEKRYVHAIVQQRLLQLQTDDEAARASVADYGAMDEISRTNDMLSELFGRISALCQEQFMVIKAVFPRQSALRITRLLVQRILNDPVVGIQMRVEDMLNPKPPRPSLPLADYLNALCMVHEKIYALCDMLVDYSVDLVEGSSGNARESIADGHEERKSTVSHVGQHLPPTVRMLQSHFQEQVHALFDSYLQEYFPKEIKLLHMEYNEALARYISDRSLINEAVGSQQFSSMPRIRMDRFRSLLTVLDTVANDKFAGYVIGVTAESLSRCGLMCRDDRDLYSKLVSIVQACTLFLVDGIFIPCTIVCSRAMAAISGSVSSTAGRVSKNALRIGTNVSEDLMHTTRVIAAVQSAVQKFRQHVDENVNPELKKHPTSFTVAREFRRKKIHQLDRAAADALTAWSTALVCTVDRQLDLKSMRSDYMPKAELLTIEPSAAVQTVADILEQHIGTASDELKHVKLSELYASIGKRVCAVMTAHIKRSRISEQGAFVLARDMDLLLRATELLHDSGTTQALTKLRALTVLYMTPADNVVTVYHDLLRQKYDKMEVLSLVKRRADYRVHGVQSVWAKELFAEHGISDRMSMRAQSVDLMDNQKRTFMSRLHTIIDHHKQEQSTPTSTSSPPWSPTTDPGRTASDSSPRSPTLTPATAPAGTSAQQSTHSSPTRSNHIDEEESKSKTLRSTSSFISKFKNSSQKLFGKR